ncbi:hypothetical protein ABH15_08825 [Methanoculleus taiwanensis]|uniref:Uncharacterized protein n=1 Tax=Methanoculleus taiwanensis TaxID=1550565 RepID=A0A498H2N6_9EURY|nr:hypothetical protein ABH15_08825 [Methanoculleus taiwanensis]
MRHHHTPRPSRSPFPGCGISAGAGRIIFPGRNDLFIKRGIPGGIIDLIGDIFAQMPQLDFIQQEIYLYSHSDL